MTKNNSVEEIRAKEELVKLKQSFNKITHTWVMEELKYKRETESICHEHAMTRQRIKSAEIRRAQEFKMRGRR